MPRIEISTIAEVPEGTELSITLQRVNECLCPAREQWISREGWQMLPEAKVAFLRADGSPETATICEAEEAPQPPEKGTTNLAAVIFEALADRDHPRHQEAVDACNDAIACPFRIENWRRQYDNVRYFVAEDGHVWKGPINQDDNLHWARMEGRYNLSPDDVAYDERQGTPVWVVRRTDPPRIVAFLDDAATARLHARPEESSKMRDKGEIHERKEEDRRLRAELEAAERAHQEALYRLDFARKHLRWSSERAARALRDMGGDDGCDKP